MLDDTRAVHGLRGPEGVLLGAAGAVSALERAFVPSRQVQAPTICMLDSGLGGLTVFREVARARPDARFVYVADDALFPYGAVEESRLVAHVAALVERLLAAHRPDLVVIACNTASTVVLPHLRERFAVPFVGTVPAVKPACAASASGRVSVLGTEGTVKREYTRALIRAYAGACRVTLVGAARLAAFAEAELAGEPVPDEALREEIAPAFVADEGGRTDTVVLACTHYPLLVGRMAALAPWRVGWIDPAPAIARRVLALLGDPPGQAPQPARQIVFTSGRAPSPALARSLAAFGFGA